VQYSQLHLSVQFDVVFSFCCIQYWVTAYQYYIFGSRKAPYYNCFAAGLDCGFWLPPADHISLNGKTSLDSNTMWYDREYVRCHIWVISILWVCFLSLAPPVCDICYPKRTADHHRVRVVIIQIWINLAPDLWWFRRGIGMDLCGYQWACRVITASLCCLGHFSILYIFIIIAGQIICIIRTLTRSRSHCWVEAFVAGYSLGLLMDNRLCLAQYSFSTYFRQALWYWVV